MSNLCTDVFAQYNGLLGVGCQLNFKPITSYFISNTARPIDVAAAYINHDSYLDIIVLNLNDSTITVLLGHGNGTFQMGNTYSTGIASSPYVFALGDLNNDSRMDIVAANYQTDNIAIFFGNGDGTFQTRVVISTGSNTSPAAVVIGYINNDARLDIAVANYGKGTVGVFLGYGNGTFRTQKTTSTGNSSSPAALVMGDFDRDNLQDLAVATKDTNMAVVLLGLGTNSFRPATMHNAGSQPYSIDRADFNGDLILDLAVLNRGDSSVSILLGKGNGTFGMATTLALANASNPSAVVAVDLNQDGYQDVMATNDLDDSISILLGRGDGSFQARKTVSLGVGSAPNWIAVADFDNDGRLDVAVTNYGLNTVGILLRTC